jgi:radical SAM superfamily enzyme with C-terminal helix-hairpin-helix motif
VVLVDGYVDEPTCLGVPPYLSTYPRYIAGAIWEHDPHAEILYYTIDRVRESFDAALNVWSTADLVVLIAGMVVPGKYMGGTPISVRETKVLFSDQRLSDTKTMLVGPWASHGCGLEGGRAALEPGALSPPFGFVAPGSPEMVIADVASHNWDPERAQLDVTSKSLDGIQQFSIRGSRIVAQHPNYARRYLIAEIETYRGCARYITGGCSFCVEPLFGEPQLRRVDDIVGEIKALYEAGVRAFRLGRQADLFVYGSPEIGEEEFPTPDPGTIEELFSKIRRAAPSLDVLHIDNVNPGTIAHHPTESREVARVVMKYHTTGDVAAFGLESLDPVVIKRNNLKVTADEALEALRILNEVGGVRPGRGLPHLLPGINLLYGLPGESRATLDHNMVFLKQLVDEGLMVRRINIRQVIGFSGTRLEPEKRPAVKQHQFFKHKAQVREEIDLEMIRRVAPPGTVIQSVYFERSDGNGSFLRPLGTYPLLCRMSAGLPYQDPLDVVVIDHGSRSVSCLSFPIIPTQLSLAQWTSIPGIGSKRAARLKGADQLSSVLSMEKTLDMQLPEWLTQSVEFEDKN